VQPGEFNWEEIFKDAGWFHFTGITPALGEGPAKVTLEALQAAKAQGVTVSVDLNYRKKLWTPEQANKTMSQFMEYVDLVIANEEDAEKVFGIKAGESNVTAGKLSEEGYREVAKQLMDRFGLKKVAITLRESLSASDNNWSALLYNGQEFYRSRIYTIHIVDRVGGGDSFGGGLINGLLSGKGDQDALEFAVAASCLKHTVFGDYNLMSAAEVELLAKGDASGRVQR
jgi:2-dehydro-3-deoxygluconokinase